MLRIHFTTEDLARTRITPVPEMSAEVLMSLRRLSGPGGDLRLRAWQRGVAASWNPASRLLFDLFAPALTPAFVGEAVRSDPRATAEAVVAGAPGPRRHFLTTLAGLRPATGFTRRLADDEPDAVRLLGRLIGGHQALAVDPFEQQIRTLTAADRDVRVRTLAAEGMGRVLETLHPLARWRPPVLEIVRLTPGDVDVHLGGRGLLLQPGVFVDRLFYADEDPTAQPHLLYPVSQDGWCSAHTSRAPPGH